MKVNKVYCIDVFEGLKKLADNSVDCVVTSPPYWALRDYGVKGQLGLEEHPQKYINTLVLLMKELKRIIKPTGTIWLNLGDSYYTKFPANNKEGLLQNPEHLKLRGKYHNNWLQPKQKLLMPYRVAIQCQDELGLILRNDITWIKQCSNFKNKSSIGSSMPTSVQDRLNNNSESIFFFSKERKYYFNLKSIKIPCRTKTFTTNKNPGDCIIFPLEPSREKHCAMFPKTLPEFCIKASCPKGGIVLDPFMGSGTTAIVAKKLGRKFIGFELNKNYIKIINRRLSEKYLKEVKLSS